jgi:peptidoglycan/LPS O-acetylase OafA/YrhL
VTERSSPSHRLRTTGDRRFPALDGLRAAGALAVLTTHVGFESGDALTGPFAGVLARLDAGVALFFVISGFLLFRPYAEARLNGVPLPDVRSYLWHRAVRILPVLWVAVVAAAVLLWDPRHAPWGYLANAFLVQIYTGDYNVTGLTQMWSLATEAAFYVALPLVGWLVTRRGHGRRWVLGVFAGTAVLALVGPVWMGVTTALGMPVARLWLPGFIGWFAAGAALATWHCARSNGTLSPSGVDVLAQRAGTVWALAASLFLLISTPLGGPLSLSEPAPFAAAAKNAFYGLIGLLLVLPAVSPAAASGVSWLSGKVAHVLGSISYGVFAYHVIVLTVLERALGLETFKDGFAIRFWGTLVLSVALAALSFYRLERPLMTRARRRDATRTYLLERAR